MLSVESAPPQCGAGGARGTLGARGEFAGGQDVGEEFSEGGGAAGQGPQEAGDTVSFLSLRSVAGGLGFLLPGEG